MLTVKPALLARATKPMRTRLANQSVTSGEASELLKGLVNRLDDLK